MQIKFLGLWKKGLCLLIISMVAFTVGCAGTIQDLDEDYGLTEADKKNIESYQVREVENEEQPLYMKVMLYPFNRIMDGIDMFRFNGALGPGFGFNLRATKAAQVGVENYFAVRAGLGKRGSLFFPRYGVLYTETEVATMGVGPVYTGGSQRGATEVGGTFHLGVVGAEAAVDLSEIADFFAGFVLLDLKGDDY